MGDGEKSFILCCVDDDIIFSRDDTFDREHDDACDDERDDAFDEETVRQRLRSAWSPESSSLWTEENPARGHCGVTALVIQDQFGGEIRKTSTDEGWHFYNYIGGERYDLTADQFDALPEYLDLPSDREEAFGDTNADQYAALSQRFLAEFDDGR